MLNICFLGGSILEYDGKRFEDQFGNKVLALICLLVLNEKRYLSREKIIGYLWPESNDEAARYNLRYNLWFIKKNINDDKNGNPFLRVDKDCCGINMNYEFESDILAILKFNPSSKDSIESVLKLKKLFRGDLLEGCYFNKCDEFNDLIIFERINFEQRKVKILKRLVELYEKEKNYDSCIEIINEILEIEPYDEKMVLKILDIYIKCGNRGAAITYYKNFSYVLAGSLGISPSEELRNKYNEMRIQSSDNDETDIEIEKNINSNAYDNKKDASRIKIISNCMKNIEYFWIADVVGKIVNVVDTDLIKKLSKKELLDLGYIQRDILKYCSENGNNIVEYKQEVMGVCIVNSFIKLLTTICKDKILDIIILNSQEIDEISANVLKYLKRIEIEGLNLIEE